MNAETIVGESPPRTQDRTAQWARIPQALRDRPQWCVAAPDKAPWTVSGGRRASSTDATTWTTFDAACAAASAKGWHIGYMLSADDPFACVDLDVCDEASQIRKGKPVDPSKWTTPEQMVQFWDIAQNSLASYTERSTYGKGLHVLVRANIGAGCKRDSVEVYSQERFIVCTGDVAIDAPIEDRQEMLTNMVSQMRGSQATTAPYVDEPERDPDDAIIARASAAANGAKFKALWAGDRTGYGSHSEADAALMGLFAFYSPNNAQVKRLFRMSELGKREKATKDDRYLDRTLSVLRGRDDRKYHIEHGRQIAERLVANWIAKQQAQSNGTHFRILTDKDLQRLSVPKWLVKNIIPETGFGAIYGDSGTFKTFVALDMLAHISNGRTSWFNHRVTRAPCVYIPFEGRGGIPKRVAAWRIATARVARPDLLMVAAPIDDVTTNMAFITDPMNLREKTDRDKLVATLTANKCAGGVLCIDTLAQAGGGIEENTSDGMGEMIRIFQELQHRLGGVVLVIHHSGKDKKAGLRGHSSLRGALDFAIECERPDNAPQYHAQFNLDKVKDEEAGKTFPFVMQRVFLGHDSDGDEVASLVVNQPSITEQLTAPPTDTQREEEDDTFVYDWVKREVTEGRHPSGSSLEGQRAAMKEKGRDMTQKQLRDAIARLKANSLLKVSPVKSPSNNAWLTFVDRPNTSVQA